MKPLHRKGNTHATSTQAAQPGAGETFTHVSKLCAHLLNLKLPGHEAVPSPSLPLQHLLCFGRQSGLCDTETCNNTLGVLALGKMVSHRLREPLHALELSETRYLILVTLHAMDPEPSNPADLAYHVDATRPSVTEALHHLADHGWISREHIKDDRRIIHVRLTESGRQLAATAMKHFLQAANELGSGLCQAQQRGFNEIFARLLQNTLPAKS